MDTLIALIVLHPGLVLGVVIMTVVMVLSFR